MAPVMSDPTERRLRAARPAAADVPADAADRPEARALLEAARTRPVPAPRRGRRVAGGLVLAGGAAAVALAIGLPGSKPEARANPLALAIHWFAPAPGTVLHVRSTLASGRDTMGQEYWQSVDHPEQQRTIGAQDGIVGEAASDGIYDAARDTVYVNVPSGGEPDGGGEASAVDPNVAQVRAALEHGDARVLGREQHAGRDAYAIAVDPDVRGEAAKPVRWTLWIAADDGAPLELRIDNGPDTPAIETTTWQAYDLLRDAPLTVRAAHPDARVVRDADQYAAAQGRLYPHG